MAATCSPIINGGGNRSVNGQPIPLPDALDPGGDRADILLDAALWRGQEPAMTDRPQKPGTAPTARPAGDVSARGSAEVAAPSTAGDIAAFLSAARRADPTAPRGRLIFALDATMSRQPTWDRATQLQGEMFEEAGRIGGLDVQLVYFRGFGECRASRFVRDAASLASLMSRIDCRGGRTQIGRVLTHATATAREAPVAALIYVGDAMEESADELAAAAGELGMLGTRVFLFQEGRDPAVARCYAEIARLTRGAHLRFDAGAAGELAALLRAVAAYAAGGFAALEDLGRRDGRAQALLTAMTR
jgi:hypothetical protein